VSEEAWDRRDGETSAAWYGFRLYRDLGRSRSIQKAWDVYRLEKAVKGHAPSGAFIRWSREHDWLERAEAFDEWRDEVRDEARARALADADAMLDERVTQLVAIAIEKAVGGDDRWIRDLLARAGWGNRSGFGGAGEALGDALDAIPGAPAEPKPGSPRSPSTACCASSSSGRPPPSARRSRAGPR